MIFVSTVKRAINQFILSISTPMLYFLAFFEFRSHVKLIGLTVNTKTNIPANLHLNKKTTNLPLC